jgi:hypothetical protein
MNQTESPLIGFSIRMYCMVLHFYPFVFRRDYGDLMVQVFADHARVVTRQRGLKGLLTWWARTMLDTAQAVIEEHTQRGVDMSKVKFVKLSGWAFVLGSVMMFLGWWASSRPEYSPYNFLSRWYDQVANVIAEPMILVSVGLISLGMVGLIVRYGQVSSSAGRFFLYFGAISGGISFITWLSFLVGLDLTGEVGWLVFMYCLAFLFTGLALWGIECLRSRLLPRGNALPLLAGIGVSSFVFVGMVYELVTGNWWNAPEIVNVVVFTLTVVALVGLGYVLQGDVQPSEMKAQAA